MGLRIDIVTIFPAYFESPLGISLIGKAAARGDIEFRVHDLRRWAADVHHTVDDVPFGGGPGMVMKPDVWGDALDEIIPPPLDAASSSSSAIRHRSATRSIPSARSRTSVSTSAAPSRTLGAPVLSQ